MGPVRRRHRHARQHRGRLPRSALERSRQAARSSGLVSHTLFYLDLYLSGSLDGFRPPAPFTLDELDAAGVPPERVYTKVELRTYLEHDRRKCRAAIDSLTDERVRERCVFPWRDLGFAELLLYNMRHVQHHAAQLNLLLRQTIDSAPRWVAQARGQRLRTQP